MLLLQEKGLKERVLLVNLTELLAFFSLPISQTKAQLFTNPYDMVNHCSFIPQENILSWMQQQCLYATSVLEKCYLSIHLALVKLSTQINISSALKSTRRMCSHHMTLITKLIGGF